MNKDHTSMSEWRSPLRGGQGYGAPYQTPNAHHGMPLGNVGTKGTAYEPFRHENA